MFIVLTFYTISIKTDSPQNEWSCIMMKFFFKNKRFSVFIHFTTDVVTLVASDFLQNVLIGLGK